MSERVLINGTVYTNEARSEMVLTHMRDNMWGLLVVCGHRDPRITAPMFCSDVNGVWLYTAEQVSVILDKCDVAPLRLEIVRQDESESFCMSCEGVNGHEVGCVAS